MGEERPRGRDLGDASAHPHEHDPVAEPQRLVDVVGDDDDGLAHQRLHPQQLSLEPQPGDRVQGAEGLVHEQHRGIGAERAGDPDALALAPGEGPGQP